MNRLFDWLAAKFAKRAYLTGYNEGHAAGSRRERSPYFVRRAT
jgi:hypothetical protein